MARPGEDKEILNGRDGSLQEIEQGVVSPFLDATIQLDNSAMKGLTDIAGIRVGHVSDLRRAHRLHGRSCASRARWAAWICAARPPAPRRSDVLSPGHVTERIHAVVLAGGSAFGLEAARGVRRFLEHEGSRIRDVVARTLPIVPCAILYRSGHRQSQCPADARDGRSGRRGGDGRCGAGRRGGRGHRAPRSASCSAWSRR